MAKLPAAVQALIFVVLIVLATGAVGYYFVLPLYNDPTSGLVALQKQEKDLEGKVQRLEAFKAKLTEYRVRLDQLDKDLAHMDLLLPETRQTDRFMNTVFDDAAATDVHVRTFIPQPEVQRDFYVDMPFSVRLDGTYWGLVKFYAKLANEARIISVTGVGEGEPKGGGKGAYTPSLNETVGTDSVLTTYYRHEAPPKPVGKGPAPVRR
jgi:type IV pilus assembly protein PilO